MSFATLSARRSAAARLFAVAVLALAWLLGLSAAGHAAELTFNRAYLGALSGQTYTTTTLLNADPGSIRFSDDGTQRTFHNTSGTLYYTVGGAPRAEAGQLKARYPNGNVVVDAVAFEGSAGFRLIVLGGSYTTSSSYGGSSNGIVDRLNEYILATAPDSAQTTIRANGAASATANVGASVTITVAVKLTSGAAVSGATVTLAASPSNLSSTTPTSAVTNASGEASFTVTGTAKGTVTYTAVASAGGSTATSAGSVSVTYVGVRSAARSTATVAAGVVGAPTKIVVTVRDGDGDLVRGASGGLTLSVGGANAGAALSAIVDKGDGTYEVTYTPGHAGTDTIVVELDGTPLPASPYSSTVTTAPVAITTTSLPTPVIGVAYSRTVSTSGGTAPVSFSVTAGALPAGLSLDATTGAITGTPTTAGAYSFTITASDTNSITAAQAYSGTIGAGLAITTTSLPTPVIGVAYSRTVSTSGGTAPVSFSVTAGALPAGLSLDATTGAITGTPTTAGAYSFTITASDTNSVTAAQAYSGTIGAGLAITTTSLSTPVIGVPYSQTVSTSGGTAPVSFSVTAGALPAGLSLDATTGAITGTPTTAGAYSFTITASDTNSITAAQAYSGTIGAGLAITTTSLPTPVIGAAYSRTVSTSGGTAPVSFSVTAGALPAGLSLDATTGAITGTPTTAGAYSFTITASDTNSITAGRSFTGTIIPAAAPEPPAPPPPPPETAPQSVTVPFESPDYVIDLARPDGATVRIVSGVSHGVLTLEGGVANYVPEPGYVGRDVFTYVIVTASGASQPVAVTIDVQPPAPPTAISPPTQTLGNAAASTSTSISETAFIDMNPLVSGVVSEIQLRDLPRHGTVVLRRSAAAAASDAATGRTRAATALPPYSAAYTPQAGFVGRDSFTFVAIGPGGVSAPAIVTIDVVAPAPTAAPIERTVLAGQQVSIDLTGPAQNGPFAAAALVSRPPASTGEARLVEGGVAGARSYRLEFRSAAGFAGPVVLTYTLSNAQGVSEPLRVTITVVTRPDPSRDATVRGLLSAETETARRFAGAQIDNYRNRLESLRGGGRSRSSLQFVSGVVDRPQPRAGLDPIGGPDAPAASPTAAAAPAQIRTAPGPRAIGEVETWVGGAVSIGHRDAATDRAKLSFATSGLSLGADVRLSEAVSVGVGAGFARSDTDVGADGSRADATAWSAAVYGSYVPTLGLFLDGVAGAAELDFDLRRAVATGALARGQRDGHLVFGAVTAGVERNAGLGGWSAYGRMEAMRAELDGYRETAPDLYGLQYESRTIDSLVGVLGLRAQGGTRIGAAVLAPHARIELQHDFRRTDAQRVRYADWLDGPVYAVDADGWASTRLTLGLGAGVSWSNGWTLDLDLSAEAARRHRAGVARVGVSRSF